MFEMETHYTLKDFEDLYTFKTETAVYEDISPLAPEKWSEYREAILASIAMKNEAFATLKSKGLGRSLVEILSRAKTHVAGCQDCMQEYRKWCEKGAYETTNSLAWFRNLLRKEGRSIESGQESLEESFRCLRFTMDLRLLGVLQEKV